jgi:5'-nucleotidase
LLIIELGNKKLLGGNRMKKKVLSLLLILLLILNSFSFAFAAEEETTKITIVHTNDTHARLEGSSSQLGFAKIATLINEAKAANPNTLVLDAGDVLHGMPIVNVSYGENAVKVLNAAGYDYITLGNHDFNYGKDRLFELKDMAKFGMLSANIVNEKGEYVFTPYVIKEFGGVKVGIFGLTTPDAAFLTNPKNVTGLTFEDPIAVSKKMVDLLDDETDVIIALAHIGLDESSAVTSKELAESVNGIDVIIDGHSHTLLETGKVVNNTLIAQTKNYGENLGYVDIEVKGGQVVSKTARLLKAADAAATAADPVLTKAIDEIKALNQPILSQVVAKTEIYLDGVRENVRTKETNLGNLAADAARTATGAEVAFVNGGGIREDIQPGDITRGKVAAIFPFGNTIQVKKITGEDLLSMLELSVGKYPASQGAFLQVSGLTFEFDPAKAAGSRVVEAKVGDKPIDKAAEYSVAVNDFMAAGGDGYTMLSKYPVAAEFETYEAIFEAYLKTNGTKGCDVSGRIKVVAAPVQTVKEETYIVVPGDVLWRIAVKYNTTWKILSEYNKMSNPNLIFPGQAIKVPVK